ncbi:hypothetical protein NLG97_g1467 [Lecanicillium saksenae]|uniref:Uncharacterized protein n=1 Tax=Lecanicillium saksenae TaxID=468837 RepID=A0ACC1R739_9HYPO|nr:hypothetical protein NLG97_g1467 [Lecanicillium saksenae]
MSLFINKLISAQQGSTKLGTASQQFLAHYLKAIDNSDSSSGPAIDFYDKKAVFHSQNGTVFSGRDEIEAGMGSAFGRFQRLQHESTWLTEIKKEDGTTLLVWQGVRNIWRLGNSSATPDVSAPISLIGTVAKDISGQSEALKWQVVFLYWDTALLA